MPVFRSSPDLAMHYEVNDYTDPWTRPETILLLHGGLATVEQTRAWQQQIPNSKLLVLPGDSYHVAVTDAGTCARATLDFIAQNGA